MKILFLGYPDCDLLTFLKKRTEVTQTMKRVKDSWIKEHNLTISFGYRYLISESALKIAPRPPLNIHISFLPFNRGANPNYWSFVDNTPKGVTIHEIDKGLDTGKIVFRKKITFTQEQDTLSKTYNALIKLAQQLFITNWERIKIQSYSSWKSSLSGSFHSIDEEITLTDSWNTRIDTL